ncbi:MAG: hypothetical protein L6Q26_13135, partial [Anaerolineales bacterium]|nr:hypothetical protein [Anaerolineales bacterium]
SKDEGSLLNAVKRLLKFRRENSVMQEGAMELLDGLPKNVLGFARKTRSEKRIVLLNFGKRDTQFPFDASECHFKLTGAEELKEKAVRLNGFGGAILA